MLLLIRTLSRLLVLPLALALGGCTGLFFQPSRSLYELPERHGYPYEIVRFKSTDGTPLTGLFFDVSTGTAKGTVLHFHGNAQNVSSHFGYSAWLSKQGYQVFIFDYRGYGASEGRPSEEGLVQDGIAALRYLQQRKDVRKDRLAVWGQSLGGAVAVASLALSRAEGVKAVILEDTFPSYRAVARQVLSRSAWTRPFQWLPWLLVSERHSPLRYLAALPRCPVLMIQGEADPIVPSSLGRELFARLAEPKELWIVPGGGHLDAFAKRAAVFRPRLIEFLDRSLR